MLWTQQEPSQALSLTIVFHSTLHTVLYIIISREQEIREKKIELERTNEISSLNQAKVSEQLLILEKKLEEHKLIHKQNEEKMMKEINEMTSDLGEVKQILDQKIQDLDDETFQDDRTDNRFLSIELQRASRASSLYVEVGDSRENLNDSFTDE